MTAPALRAAANTSLLKIIAVPNFWASHINYNVYGGELLLKWSVIAISIFGHAMLTKIALLGFNTAASLSKLEIKNDEILFHDTSFPSAIQHLPDVMSVCHHAL